MDKFLIFIDQADDAAMFPVANIQSMTVAADATLIIKFAPGSLGDGQAASIDSVTLTITADKELDVFKALADKIADIGSFSGSNSLVVCDDVNSVFAHSDILSCTISLDA
jgi:hypothetical protein|tara:strand:- start:70 stop:399 length:330 start_codon:yes stop_codon:yes gene_type:complete